MKKICASLALLLAAIGLSLQPVLAAKQKDPIKVTSAKSFAGIQQVTIGQFTVAFLTERKDNARAGGGLMGGGFGGRSTVRSQLMGVDNAQLQATADAAYDDFTAKLRAQGFAIADRADLATALAVFETEPNFKPVKTMIGDDDKAEALLVGATQTGPLRTLVGDQMTGGLGAIGVNQKALRLTTAMQAHSKQTGVRVVNVIYYVNFASSEEYGGRFRSSSAVKVNSGLGIAPGLSRVSVFGAAGSPGVLTLNEPVAVGGDFFTQEDAMSGGEKATRAVTKVIGILGGIGANSYKKFSFTALPGAYPDGAAQAAAEANSLFVQRLATLR